MEEDRGFETLVVEGESEVEESEHNDVVDPVHLSTNFELEPLSDTEHDGYVYGRFGNPTRHRLEDLMADLEGGGDAVAVSSGMSAISTVCLTTLSPGDSLVAFESLFGGTKEMFDEVLSPWGIDVRYVDASKPERVEETVDRTTGLVWAESPTNPLLRLCDVRAVARIAKRNDATFAVDNTFSTPYVQRPVELGADAVVYSATKFLNGHSDTTGGFVVTDEGAEALAERLRFVAENGLGAVMQPFDCYLVRRGLKTLPARMDRHMENAERVARFLDSHPKVDAVHYPGLEGHPQHELADEQMDGFGGVVSFEVEGGEEAVERFLSALDVFNIAVSLGGVESLIEHTASMSAGNLTAEERDQVGISDSLVRAPVGVENADDLIDDLRTGLSQV